MSTQRITTFILAVILSLPAALFAEQHNEPLALEEAVNLALLANPNLASLKARTRSLAEIPGQKGSLPDPLLTFRAANLPTDTFSTTQEPMTQMQIAFSQALPFPGKLSLRQEIAGLESTAADFNYEEQRLLLIQDVKLIWWNIFYLDRALETIELNRELFRQLNTIAQTKYQVGKGLQQDVLMAQLELSKLLDNKISLENMRQNEVIRLNTLVDRPAERKIDLSKLSAEEIPSIPDLQRLLREAELTSPALMDMSTRTEAARKKVELAEMKFYPDFKVGAAYGYRGGENPDGSDRADFASFSLSLNLPFFNRKEKQRAVSQQKYEAYQRAKALRSAENGIRSRVTKAFNDFTKNTEEIALLRDGIIPQAKQTLESMLAGYQVNKVDFLNLIRAQTSVYNFETRYWRSYSRVNQAAAQIAAATGKENIDG